MAGLQQYNFFPTDFLYPRPQPQASPATLESASGKAAAVFPVKSPNRADQNQQQQLRGLVEVPPTTAALVYNQRRQSLNRFGKNQSKFSTNSLAWLSWVEEEEGSDSF